jgi:hypothetical protein
MAADARCRCGSKLRFQRGATGYKTRCPACHAVVRLRLSGGTKQGTSAVSVSEPTPVSTKWPAPIPPLEPPVAPEPEEPLLPVIQLSPLPSRSAALGMRIWSWPVWLASAVAMALIVGVLLLVRRS